MLYNHDYDKLIGQWVEYRIEGDKFTAAPAFDENDELCLAAIQQGRGWHFERSQYRHISYQV
jgi:hypothetical protein